MAGAETFSFDNQCKGRNIEVNRNIATWQDNTSHEFASKHPLSKMIGENMKFQFSGNGHGTMGVVHVPEGSYRLNWVHSCSLNIKNRNGCGDICFFEDMLILYINGKIATTWLLEQHLYSELYLAVAIHFGFLKITFSDLKESNLFLSIGKIAEVTEGKILQLKTPNPGAFCVLQENWMPDFPLKIKVEPNENVAYWSLRVCVSNQRRQENLSSLKAISLIKTLENDRGDVILRYRKGENKVLFSFNGSQDKTLVENVNLNNKVYVWLELYRCRVEVDILHKPQVRHEYTDVVSVKMFADEHSWPSDSSLHQTSVKVLEAPGNNANVPEVAMKLTSDHFILELYTAMKMIQESNSSNHAVLMYMEGDMQQKLNEIKNNVECDEKDLSFAKTLLRRIFSKPHSSEHCGAVAGIYSPLDEFIQELYMAMEFVKKCSDSNHGLLHYMEDGMRRKLNDIKRDSESAQIEFDFANRLMIRVFSTLYVQ